MTVRAIPGPSRRQARAGDEAALWQLISPTLPVGAFAYSEGLESAVDAGAVDSAATSREWIGGLSSAMLGRVDLPVLARMFVAADDEVRAAWSARLWAMRESAELRASDAHLARALLRVLVGLDVPDLARWREFVHLTHVLAWSLACRHFDVAPDRALAAYAWCWMENQVAAATKLVPLGQTESQRVLFDLGRQLPDLVESALALPDSRLGAFTPGLAVLSARHEHQYTRLFRS